LHVLAIAASLTGLSAMAQTYPSKPLKLVVPKATPAAIVAMLARLASA
jgi:tripartite-type tricarboxylate transporter receptor subunit TctC